MYLLGYALDLVNMFAVSIAYPQIGLELHRLRHPTGLDRQCLHAGSDRGYCAQRVAGGGGVGEKRLLLISLLLFTAASWGVAQAASIETLIAGWLLQGLGAGC